MQTIKVKLAGLKKPEKNVRSHTETQFKEYERSVKMFGQIRPLVIDENNMIMAGVGLYDTLIRLGWEEADAYQIKTLTEAQKKKLMISDNKIFNLGVENLGVLNEFFEELKDDLDIPGFDEEILKEMMADADEITDKLSEYGKLEEDEISEIRKIEEKQDERTVVTRNPETAVNSPGNSVEKTETVVEETRNDEDPAETADIRRFVICPKCGEKIWV